MLSGGSNMPPYNSDTGDFPTQLHGLRR